MNRIKTFTFRVDEDEKYMISVLAGRLERNQSDAIRLLIRKALRNIMSEGTPKSPHQINMTNLLSEGGHIESELTSDEVVDGECGKKGIRLGEIMFAQANPEK